MLNLEYLFHDAVLALEEASAQLQIAPLPSVVFMMQRDVINQYRYALEHYLHVNLKSSFLQNSSLGTPYEKWAKFTNEDFENLFFAIGNWVRYTARLLDETLAAKQKIQDEFSESKATGSRYISQIVGIRHGRVFIGVRCEDSQVLSVIPLADSAALHRPSEAKAMPIDSENARNEVLARVIAEGEAEISRLTSMHEKFTVLCTEFYSGHSAIAPFDAPHPSYLI